MTNWTNRLLRWLLAPAVAVLAVGSAAPARAVEVGETAPPFSLTAHDGELHSLEGLRGEKNAVLIFFRGLW